MSKPFSLRQKALMQFKGVEMFNQFGNAIDKIVDKVKIATNPETKDAESIIQFEKSDGASGNEHLSVFVESIQEEKLVTFQYTSFVGGKTKEKSIAAAFERI